MGGGRSLLRHTTARARAARRGCAPPCHLRASVQVRQSAPLSACPSIFVKAHSRARRAQAAETIAQIYCPRGPEEGRQHRMAATWRAPPARGPEPAAPPGSGALTAVLGAYDEPEVEPDVSVTSSAAVQLREPPAAALLVLRAR